MNADEARALLATSHRVVFATRRADGRTQMSPVLAVVDEAGRVCVSTRETAMKTRHLRREPYAALCVLSEGWFGNWAQVEGPVEIVALPEAMELLVDYYRRASGEHADWADYRRAMTEERRVLLRMTIERAGPSVAG